MFVVVIRNSERTEKKDAFFFYTLGCQCGLVPIRVVFLPLSLSPMGLLNKDGLRTVTYTTFLKR